jgi:hypothetical protein
MEVASPCTNICKLDKKGICVGCFRTIDEIKNWRTFSEQQKIDVWTRLLLEHKRQSFVD